MRNVYESAQSVCSNWQASRTARGTIILLARLFNWLLRRLSTLAKWIDRTKHSPARANTEKEGASLTPLFRDGSFGARKIASVPRS
jgi:hypothetical protein